MYFQQEKPLIAMTDTHDVTEVLDATYLPKTQEKRLLFEEKQKLVFSVLRKNLQTGKTKKIMCEQKGTGNAQAAYQQLLFYCLNLVPCNN